jgi:hypothetical protein
MKAIEIILCIVTFALFIGVILFGLFKPNDWARCMSCGIFHNCANGRQSWELPRDFDGVIEHRFCPECSKPFLRNLARNDSGSAIKTASPKGVLGNSDSESGAFSAHCGPKQFSPAER